jgi:hypothetical protein
MNRSEFEGLIAQTMQLPPNPPLSPKQHFQSQVRGLSSSAARRQAQSDLDVRPVRHELHHVSTLRVQHKHTVSAIPYSPRTAALPETSHNPPKGKTAAITDNAVPDFSAEEREAWSKKSPKPASTSTRSRHSDRVSSLAGQKPVQHVLFPPQRLEPVPQPRKQARQSSSRQFQPLHTQTDLDERPKTSRGPPSPLVERKQAPTITGKYEAETKQHAFGDGTSSPKRRSKFLEGSMNTRSVGVASSWYHDTTSGSEGFDDPAAGSMNDCDGDGDTTPRATKLPPHTPAPVPAPTTTKKSIFRFGGGRSSEESARAVEETKAAKERKGLRKSISTWNFQSLGEKIFGGSTSDAASETSTDTITEKPGRAQKDKKTEALTDVDNLNERKRKAEKAYAQQFGLKRQKSNIGQPVPSTPVNTHGNKTSIDDKRPKTPTLFRRKRDQRTPGDQNRTAEAFDARKRPSRRDLEKENQQLRSMLRESQSVTFFRTASFSSIDLAIKDQENLVRGPAVMLSPGRKHGRRKEDIPPVPKLPHQGILMELQNRSGQLRADVNAGKGNQGSFKTIEESEEVAEMRANERERSIAEQWEWPEDVF